MDLRAFQDKRICVAISGGVDSVALLHYLKDGAKKYSYRLSAVHCEHGIRGEESLADMRFVQELCQSWKIPLFVFSDNCPLRAEREKESLETAARNFRYESFASLIEENKADFIATAHHANDEAETTLFRLARGSSLSGVGGMVEMNGYLLRPFLGWTRAEIVEYSQQNGLSWREDKTNFESVATRNKLRLEVMPKIEETVPGAVGNIVRFASLAREDDALLYEYAQKLVNCEREEGEKVVRVIFSKQKPLFRRACLIALKRLGVERDYTALHLEKLYELQDLERGAKLSMPQGVETQRETNHLLFYKKKPSVKGVKTGEEKFSQTGFDGGRYAVSVVSEPFKNEETSLQVLKIDVEKLPQDCVFRFRREGDYIYRFGGGKKSLKKFFNEKKIAVEEREYLPLIAAKDGGEVYAVCGVEISEKVKITEETKEIFYLITKKK